MADILTSQNATTLPHSKFSLYPHQELAVSKLKPGSILCGGVGSGKTFTSLAYFYRVEMDRSNGLYIVTTAAKRDTMDWIKEASIFALSPVVDSWNNIKKYENVKGAFFIFDEQRLLGSGAWVKSFLKIVKNNNWILLSATPGDTWMDYIPVMIANGFYKNRTEFIRRHVVYNTFTKYPKVDRYIETSILQRQKELITVMMSYSKNSIPNYITVTVPHDEKLSHLVSEERWNPYENRPVKEIGEYCYLMRKVVNSDRSRLGEVRKAVSKHKRVIVFYNFNYELDILREMRQDPNLIFAEYNGHKHEPVPSSEYWVYAVQYTSGSEGWNCIETNCTVFYSQSYSHRVMVQAAGRIDRLNTPFANLYYYILVSKSKIDLAIAKSLRSKKDFNESTFERSLT